MTARSRVLGRAEHAARITVAYRNNVDSSFDAGRMLNEARDQLPHGEYQEMVRRDLPFTPATARKLRIIAADHRLERARGHALLPNSWTILYELTKIKDDAKLEQMFRDGTINPKMQRAD